MSAAFDRIRNDARDFFDKVEQLKRAPAFNAADVRDAYGRLNRLRERYVRERAESALDPDEAKALAKVFDEDVFIEGMLDGRQISEHVQKAQRRRAGPPVTLNPSNPARCANIRSGIVCRPYLHNPPRQRAGRQR